MEKIKLLFFGAIALLLLSGTVSCSREYMIFNETFTGSVNHGNERGQLYMVSLAADLSVDHLLALEDALTLDALGLTTAREGGSFAPDGKSIWAVGATWKISSVESIPGLEIVKEAGDSTWTLSYDGMYSIYGNSFPTKTQVLARMLPGNNPDHHDWRTTISFQRTEDGGYSSELTSVGDIVWGVGNYSDYYAWTDCQGQFLMEVFLDGKLKDRALLTYSGNRYDYRYRNGL